MSRREPRDPFAGEEWDAFVRRVIDGDDALPVKIYNSAVGISLVPADVDAVDVKFAIELGFMVMFDKPIVAVVTPGAHVPEQLRKIATIVEGDLATPAGQRHVARTLQRVVGEQ